MAVNNNVPRIQYNGNSSGTSFAYPSIIYFETELTVISTDIATGIDTAQVLNTDYTIDPSLLGNPAGVNVVFGTAPATGVRITIARVVPFAQTLELVEGAALPSVATEMTLDELEMQIQQLEDQLSRVATLPLSTPTGQTVYQRSQDLLVFDQSTGVTPQIGITPGNYKDFTAGVGYIPTMNGGAITSPQTLVVGSTNTVVYADCAIDNTTGEFSTDPVITAADTMPSDTSTHAYDLITNIAVTVGTIAVVNVLGGGVSASRGYFYCGLLPATDGSGHLFNS